MRRLCRSLLLLISAGLPGGTLLASPTLTHAANGVETFSNGVITITYDTGKGTFAIATADGEHLTALYSAVQTDQLLRSQDFKSHTLQPALTHFQDGLGSATQMTVANTSSGLPTLIQHFVLYDDQPFVVIDAVVQSDKPVNTRHFDVLATEQVDPRILGAVHAQRILQVPYDNDMWVRFNALSIAALKGERKSSAEVTALYDESSRRALVIGSITHDVWKTAIDFDGAAGQLNRLDVYGGISSPTGVRSATHNMLPHGKVSGTRVSSPRIYVSFSRDWRDGLEAYGQANAKLTPPMLWNGPRPFGWNSWAAFGMKVDAAKFAGAANFVHDELIPHGFDDQGVVYINFDSGWSKLSDDELKASVAALQKLSAGSKTQMRPGVYWTPFATWTNDLDTPVEGTQGKYRYRDIVLKGPDGQPLPRLDNAYAIDPTHPGAQERMDFIVRKLLALGFQYIKLDFLTHGALEGVHYDPAVQTGNEAYRQGMQHLLQQIGGRMFVSLSIAPLFPSGLGHARRISCDAKGHISGENQSTEYMLNALTYGWWSNGPLYIADPDHVVLGTHADQGARSMDEGVSRFLSAVISGGMLLDSSDLIDDPLAKELAKSIYTHPRINRIATEGKAFRPVEGNTGDRAANIFVRDTATGGMYVAVFNFDPAKGAEIDLPLERLSNKWTASSTIKIVDLWTDKAHSAMGRVKLSLRPGASALLEITSTGKM
jgi:alpha-galactosidase